MIESKIWSYDTLGFWEIIPNQILTFSQRMVVASTLITDNYDQYLPFTGEPFLKPYWSKKIPSVEGSILSKKILKYCIWIIISKEF